MWKKDEQFSFLNLLVHWLACIILYCNYFHVNFFHFNDFLPLRYFQLILDGSGSSDIWTRFYELWKDRQKVLPYTIEISNDYMEDTLPFNWQYTVSIPNTWYVNK